MKVLAINASPRVGGNSDILAEKALDGARKKGASTEKIIINSLDISPCSENEYENTEANGLSIVHDDMDIVYNKVKEADGIVFVSPIFFGSVSAQAKILIDRFQCVWLSRNVKGKEIFTGKKRGVFISVAAGERKDFFENARSIVRNFFATINADYTGDMFCAGLDKKAAVLDRPELLNEAYKLGGKIV